MASKWLEERWELLIPALETLGCGQEEQIKSICERELLAWKARPSIRVASSLQKPLTETRNHIRESIPVTEENGWRNPKSDQLEHLALKYLNFSTEEWVQINMPSQEELQARQAHVLPLANPSALLAKAEQLIQMSSWPEMVVAIGLTTGRSLVEILHTGDFTQKSAYSILFAGPFTVYERLCDPFEVPTLVQAERVLDAVQRLRQRFGTHFVGVARHNISRECMTHACEAAYRHLLGLIPFPSALRAGSYKRLTRGIYSRLAVLYYCPVEVDEIMYLARITNHQEILQAKSEEERLTFALTASYREYVVLDERGVPDQRRGIRLGEEGVELLEALQGKMPNGADSLEGETVMTMQWLEKRWKWLFSEMAEYQVDDEEEEIETLCETELEAWRSDGLAAKAMSFQEMVMRTRICLRTSLPAPWNEWWNPETEEWEHIGLKYMRCTEAEWEQMRQDVLSRRLLLHDPERIVSVARALLYTGLMQREAWPELVVGIAVLTGQGMMRILKNGQFSRKTAFSLLFRDPTHENPFFPGPFEVPTLVRADLVVEAWEWLRNVVDCSALDEQEVVSRYAPVVSATASKYLSDLVPLGDGSTGLFKALFRSVYPCIALHYYCPPSAESVEYLAKICHNPLLLADPLPGEHFACAAVYKYMQYRLADERKGVRLGQPGVTEIPLDSLAREEQMCADQAELRVMLCEDDLHVLDHVRCQMGFGLGSAEVARPRCDEEAEDDGSVELVMTLYNHGVSPVLYSFIKAGLEHLRGDVAEFLYVSLREEMLWGLKLQRPFRTMLSSELRACDHPQAMGELLRRTMLTLMRYNRSVSDPRLRWYLNEEILSQMVPQSRGEIERALDIYQQEIEQHHQQFNLSADANRSKSLRVTEVIHLPNDALCFEGDIL